MKRLLPLFAVTCFAIPIGVAAQDKAPVVRVRTLSTSKPGGRFLERLELARKKLEPTASSAAVSGSRPRARRRPIYAHRPSGPGPSGWAFKTTNFDGVTYSVTPRAAQARSDKRTGDLILIAEPEDTRVYFYVNGGSQVGGTGTAFLKGQRPTAPTKGMYLLALAPGVQGRAHAFVPVRAGHITTVRFRFEGKSVSSPKPADDVKPAANAALPMAVSGNNPVEELPAGQSDPGKAPGK